MTWRRSPRKKANLDAASDGAVLGMDGDSVNPLSDVEVRVLGALVEKDITTPDYYPLSLNALVNACNQKNNRDPVMTLDEDAVRTALESLQGRDWPVQRAGRTAGSRSMSTACRKFSISTGGRSRSYVCCCCVGRRLQANCEGEVRGCIVSRRWKMCL